MTKVEYFVRLGNTNIVGPQSANVSVSGPIYCTDENCGIPVPFVDVKGHLTSVQLQMLGNRLNPSDTTGITISSDRFINSDGEPVTRVYYRPPISGPGVQSTAIGQVRLTQILTDLNLQQPSLPLDRSFSLYFAGRIGDNNRTAIEQTILNAWAGTLGISPSVLSVNINSMNDNYVSTTSDGRRVRVTQVMYTVSIQGADSQWTRFEGVEPGMLGRYITSPGLVLVQGEVTSVQGETTGAGTTERTTSPGTTPTGSTYLIQTIYLKGNISDGSQNAVEEILLNAFNSSMNGSSCCLRLYIIEQTNYIDPNGNLITGYRYNISNSTGSPLDTMTPEQTTVFTNLVNNELQRTEPFLETGAIIYTGSVQVLRPIEFAYTVDFVGDIPDSWRQAVIDVIETAWTDTYPGQYQANIVRMQEFTGDYGITVTRVYYTTTSDGQIQDPKIVTSPTNDAFTNVVQQDTDVNELYSGSSLLPYNRHHSVFLTRVVDMDSDQGVVVRNAIESAWINWRNTNSQVPQNLRNAPLRIVLLRPETYYTQDGRQLTKIRYLVLLNNTIVIGPQTANVPLSNVIFCDCEALPVPFVDIKGQLTVSQLQTLASELNPSDVDGTTTNTEVYWTSSGEPITRVYYRPPISGPGVQSTAVSQQRLDQILTNLNLEQHTSPMTRVFTTYFGGRIGNSSREAVQQGITSAWAAALGIPVSAISTNIITMDDNYFSSTSNTPVTQVTYSVSIQGADSHWTRFVGVNAGTLGQYLNSTDLTIVGGAIIRTQGGTVSPGQTTPTTTVQGGITVRPTVGTTTQTIYLTGIITEGSQPSVEEILQNALNNSNTGSSCCLRLYIIEKTSYLDPSGNIVTGYIYNVTNSTSGMPVTMTPEQTSNFTNEVNNEFQKSDPFREMPGGVAIYTGSVQGLKSVGLAYTVDFIGDLPESRRPAVLSAIEEAWHQLNPGCGCQFKATLLQTQEFTGDYSTTVSRVFYTMARDGVIQDPDSVQPPSEAVLLNTLRRDTNVNSVYVGETLIPSNRRHSLLLNRVVDIDGNDRRLIEDIITTGWLNWINLVLGNLGSAPFEVVLLRPRMYYTQDGTQLSMVQYYVVVNNTIVIGPQTANLTLTGSLVCDCDALPVPFVDVKGQLTLTQLQTFGSYLNPFDRTGSTINTETFRNTVGEEVTRVYYRPPISSPEVTTTAISPERLTEVLEFLKLEQPSRPIRRTFNMYFGGSIDDSQISTIEETITNAWATTLGIPTDAVSVRVDTMDDNYFSRTSNTQVTRVTYTVSIQGADSHWTRFVGLNAGTLIPYFNSPDLYIVGGAIIRTQGGTLPTSTISTVSGVTTVTASPTAGTTTTQTIYLTGNISEGTQPAVEEVLQNALNKSSNEGSCCLRLNIIERTSYIDPSGVVLTGYRYNVTNSTSGMPVSLTPEQTTNFTREVNNEILKSDPLLAGGVYVYTDSIQGLKTTELAYSVDLIGRIPESRQNTVLDAIEQAWQEAYPNCRCVFKANIVQTEELSGDYGITVSRVYYTVTRDGQPEDPSTVPAPSRQDVVNAVQQDDAVNQVYPGSQLIPYNQRHGLLLNKVVDMDSPEGTYIRNAIQTAWIDWRNADPSVPASLRNAELDILMLKPLKYYTQDGRQLTKIEYFVLLNNTVVIGPKRANITLTDPLFCDCEAVPVPFVDVDGELTPLQMQILGLSLNPLDTSGVTIERENFADTNGGPVTRVYYRPPITGPGVQSTDVSQQRLNQILTNLNLQQPSDPIDKSFILYIGGRLTDDDRDNIEATIRSAWSSTYNLPAGAISVKVINLDDSFVSTPGNTPVTQVKYTVTVEDADSHWTRFDGVDSGTLGRYFTPTGFTVFQGEVQNTQVTTTPQGMTQFTGETATPTTPTGTTNFVSVIYLRGNISDSNQAAVEGILQNALNKTKNGPSCCIELHIIEKTTYLDASGDVITGYRFNASNGTAAVVLTPGETSNFTNEVSNGLQTSDVLRGQGIVIYQGSVQGPTDTFSVDFVGDVPETRKQAVLTDIEKAWINTFPECGCVFRANIVKMDEFSGDFGIKVTRINYRMTKDGLVQDPKTVTPPTRQVFYNTVQGDASVNSIYSGATLIPYSQHHNVFLSKVVDMSSDEGQQVLDQIRSTWITWRNTSPAVPENLKLAPVEMKLLRPLIYYTQDGRQLTKLEYFVILNGTNVIGPQQQTDSVTFTGPLFCDCEAIPVPFVEVKGRLSSAQLQTLGFNLNPSDGSAVSSEMFYNSKNEPVTRVYYRPPISNPDVTSTAINQQRLNQILTNQNLEQPSLPTEKSFTVNIAGRTGNNNRNAIIQILKNLWVTTFNVPSDSVSIDVKTIDENYVSSTSNAPVTQVTYAVAIQGADSHLTQFEGVDPGTLGQYFRSLGIILVEGDVVRVQGRTTPSSGTGQTANPTTPTGTTNFVNVIVLRGNVSDSYRAAVEKLLQNALNKTKNGPSCCIQLYVIEQSTIFDPNGDVLTSYRFNATNSSAPVMLTPEEIANFTYEVSNGLQTSDVLRGQGIVIYQGPVQGPTDTYSVDFVGDVPETRKQAVLTDIIKAWMNAYPDCRCEFNADVVRTDEFGGDFGVKVTRVYYTITKDGLVQDPKTVTPPTRQVFYNTVQGGASVNSIYSGATLIPYSQHHDVFLSKVVDMSSDEGQQVLDQIRSTWITWRSTSPAVPENLKLAPVEIKLLRPLIYYTQDGRQLTKLEYFVILNGTNVIGPQQQTDSVTFTGPLFCDCEAIPVPFVEVKGRLSSAQLQTLGFNLNPSDGSAVSSEMFFNSKNEPVTRVYYRPPISNPDVTSTAINQQRLNQILTNQNLEQPSLPTEKSFTVNIAGRTGNNNRNAIIQILKNLWVTTFNVPSDSVSIDVKTIDENYVSSTSNAPVTQVTYTVAIQGVDSHLTQFEGVDPGTLDQYFRSLGIILVEGDVVQVQGRTTPSSGTGQTANPTTPTGTTNTVNVIVLRGNVSDSYRAAVEELLQNALNKTKNGPSCCIQLYVIEQSTIFDPNGDVLTSYRFNATNSSAPVMLTPEEIANFTYEVSNGLQTSDVLRGQGIVIYQGPVQGPTDTYSVDFVGDVPETRKQAVLTDIIKAWMNAYPDCRCEFNADVVRTDEFAGDFGIKITRVYYTVTKDGQVQDPKTVTPPTRQVFYNTVQGDASVNSIYSGATLIPYSQHHNVFLSKVVDMSSDEGQQVLDQIRSTWITWRSTSPAVPENLRQAPVEIRLLRPSIYYTQDGRQLTKLEYFVILNGTTVIGPQPQTDSVTFTGPLFCDCNAIPVPFIEVKGRLSPDELKTLGSTLNPSVGLVTMSEMFISSNNEPVTRVYYRPPISGPDVTSTAVSQQTLNQILTNWNLEQPTMPTEKSFALNFAGRIGDNDRSAIQRTIRNLWGTTFNISANRLSVDIKSMDDSYVSSTSNTPVTRVIYTVTIQGADSRWTQFEGVDPGTLGQYFRSNGFTLVEGNVERTTQTTSGTGSTATTPSPTDTTNLDSVIYLTGDISNNNQAAMEEILKNALNKTKNGPACCIELHITDKTNYLDTAGNIITAYRYNATNGSTPIVLTPTEKDNFTREVNNELQTSGLFRGQGIQVYQGSIQAPTSTYTVDFVGEMTRAERGAVITNIEKAWRSTNPDCRCLFKASILTTEELSGDFGTLVTRVFYTITKDGLVQDPNTVTPPTRQVFYNTVQGDASVNSIYSGATLIPYSQHHDVFLSKVVDMSSDEGQQVLDQIRFTWNTWRNADQAVPENLRNAPVEIRPLRPLLYYTQDGKRLTKLEYFVILNGTNVIGPQPQTERVTVKGPLFCDCKAIPVPFIEVNGLLSSDQLKSLGSSLNPSDGSDTISELFITSNNEPVTRVYYLPQISGPDVMSTAVSPQRVNQILTNQNLEEPTLPTEKTFTLNFEGSVGNDKRAQIQQTIKNLWIGTFKIPSDALSVNIKSLDDGYVSSSNAPVTRMTYTVSIRGADSRWTRFEGVDPARYFTTPDLVVFGGEITRRGSGTSTSTTMPTPGPMYRVGGIYLKGNINDLDQPAIEASLQRAMDRINSGSSCCVKIDILKRTNYINPAEETVVGYRYNMTNSTGGTVNELTPEQSRILTNELNRELQNVPQFRWNGVAVYTGPSGGLRNLGITYSMSITGTVPDRQNIIDAIEQSWRNTYPDCGCQFKADIFLTKQLSGDYGMVVTRVYYTITRDGQAQNAETVPSPPREVLSAAVDNDKTLNPLYYGSTLLPYDQHHSVVLNRVVDMTSEQGQEVLRTLQTEWKRWQNTNSAVPDNLRALPLEILLLRPQKYYTQAGTSVTNVEYFVKLGDRYLIGPDTSINLSGGIFCDCDAIPVPFVDVKGQLQWSKLLELGTSLNPADTTGSTVDRQMFLDGNGEPVTRVFYRPAIEDGNVQSTALKPERLDEILTNHNLERPSLPIKKTFTFNFDGSLGDDKRNTVADGLLNAWSSSLGIPKENVSVVVSDMNDNFYSTTSADQVTQVTYTVALLGGDSHWTRFEGVDAGTLGQKFSTTPEVTPCGCLAREGREIMVTGVVGNDTTGLETALTKAWMQANPDYTGSLTVGIKKVEGDAPTKLRYIVTPAGGPSAFTENDLTTPQDDLIGNEISPLDLTVYKGKNDDESNTSDWAIPLGIVLGLLLLLIIIIVIVLVIRNRRRRQARTIENDASKFQERSYDKEHFTTQPVYFENEVYSESQGFYVVNADESKSSL
ncbi:uncharacterized protein [Haliotis cracherodii]|uniref:uncharacterized protein isoform X2 n=1 Tax=Haliotis cracherodii TaxID=6455 RepID=UPI0039ED75AA